MTTIADSPTLKERGTAMRRLIAIATVTGMTVPGLVAAAGPTRAVVPGTNGRIVFSRETCTHTCMYSIVAANPNDTDENVLAGPYPRDAYDDHFIANWAPAGTSVIFMLYNEIWQVRPDGTGLHELLDPPEGTGVDDGPTFTPDGARIVFTLCCPEGFGYSLWMINAEGTGLRDVTKEPVFNGDGPADDAPQVSPDGKHIVFSRCFPDQPNCVIATVNISGNHLRQLTDSTQFNAQRPNWSPDSKKIVFEVVTADGTPDIATMNADGSGLTQLTFNTPGETFSHSPCYSPDGTKILFQQRPSTAGGVDLFTMNLDGSGTTQVTRTPTNEREPEWAVGPGRVGDLEHSKPEGGSS